MRRGGSPIRARAHRRLAAGLLLWALAGNPALAGAPVPAELAEALGLAVYSPPLAAPGFTAQTPGGEAVSLDRLRGRIVLISFWASWCAECRPEMPQLEALHREFAAAGLAVLGVNVKEDAPTIERYAGELGLTFPLVLDPAGAIYRAYGVIGVPTTFVIDRDGRAVARAVGARDWSLPEAWALVRRLVEEPVPPPAGRE